MFPRGRSGPQEKRVPALLSSCARCMQDDTPNSFRKLLRRLRAPRFSWCEYTLSPSAVGVVISGLLYHPCRLRNGELSHFIMCLFHILSSFECPPLSCSV
ncbi:hypothetical protein AcV7_010380 [Taiwanofungus camphoratus]|nr:hypothetical protein AcV7_010380 [Antrodia cinnamomea]